MGQLYIQALQAFSFESHSHDEEIHWLLEIKVKSVQHKQRLQGCVNADSVFKRKKLFCSLCPLPLSLASVTGTNCEYDWQSIEVLDRILIYFNLIRKGY